MSRAALVCKVVLSRVAVKTGLGKLGAHERPRSARDVYKILALCRYCNDRACGIVRCGVNDLCMNIADLFKHRRQQLADDRAGLCYPAENVLGQTEAGDDLSRPVAGARIKQSAR